MVDLPDYLKEDNKSVEEEAYFATLDDMLGMKHDVEREFLKVVRADIKADKENPGQDSTKALDDFIAYKFGDAPQKQREKLKKSLLSSHKQLKEHVNAARLTGVDNSNVELVQKSLEAVSGVALRLGVGLSLRMGMDLAGASSIHGGMVGNMGATAIDYVLKENDRAITKNLSEVKEVMEASEALRDAGVHSHDSSKKRKSRGDEEGQDNQGPTTARRSVRVASQNNNRRT